MRRNAAVGVRGLRGVTVAGAVVVSLGMLSACGSDGESPLSTIRNSTGAPTGPVASPGESGLTSGLDEKVENESLSVGELVRRAKQSAGKIKTVHVVADVTSKGKAMKLDLRVDRASENFVGTIEQGSVRLEVRRIGSAMYIRGDESAYRTLVGTVDGEMAAKLLAGKWLKGSTNDDSLRSLRNITTVADPGAVLKSFPENGVKLPTETVNGRKMIPLTGPPGKDDGKVYIEAQGGRPYPVMVVSEEAENSGTVSYGDFDQPVKVDQPPAGDVIDIPKRSSASATPSSPKTGAAA
ncbi:hypothetical protein [Streptomyces sp. SID3343]|uniref:hypothetical protein n=1 Tax=Streptomyces sp. SID3343 TaxID=2690260 RepID=UPI00136A8B32|nr:hypothetical protein [Streptomyces sp. SID3343]MYW05824.1 hypothetical protein [Streptomyces sp. SID3343]